MTPPRRPTLPGGRRPAPTGSWDALWRMREYLRPHWLTVALSLVLGVGALVTAVAVPLLISRVVDGPLAAGEADGVATLVRLVAVLGVVEAGMALWRRWIQSTTAVRVERSVRDDLYRKVQALPPSFHDGWHTGQLLTRMTGDLSTIRRFASFGLVFGVINVISVVMVCLALVYLDRALGLLVGAALVPVTGVTWRFARSFGMISRRAQDEHGDLTTVIEESATGIRVIKAFGRGDLVAARFDQAAAGLRGSRLEMVRLRAQVVSALSVIPNATLAAVLLLGASAVASGRLTLGELVAFIALALQLVWPIESTGFILASAQEAATAAQRVYELLDTEPEITSPPLAAGPGRARRARGHLRLDGVGFAYPGGAGPVLREVDLELLPGQTLALVGATGSGKSTLAMLLPRLIDPSQGRVLLDGTDLRRLPLPWLRTAVATAFEEAILFSASVRENVTLGRPQAGDDEVHEALTVAQAQFVHDLPWGLDTRVGEQGMSLSGGQRQRLALARAVLGRPPVLVLDDPLSALDVETEARVERALRDVLTDTTALLVAHRPSTVALADRVALLHGGRVAALGTHTELLATDERYAAVIGQTVEDDLDSLGRGVFS